MNQPVITIGPGTLDEVLALYPSIPELVHPHGREEYERRFQAAPAHLVLVARAGAQPVGFKVGYEREPDGSFYSWMGGVARTHRRQGVAQQLAGAMEQWARAQSYHALKFTTRNSHRAMLSFAIGQGFDIYAVEPRATLAEYRVRLVKSL
jgi:GNAT superfamily N-acetyltransferase